MFKSAKLLAAILLSASVTAQAKSTGDCVTIPKSSAGSIYAMSQPSPTGLITKKLDNAPFNVLAVSGNFLLITSVESDSSGKHTCKRYGWVADSDMIKLPMEKCADKQNVCK